jgi:hypothetical protein
MDNSFGLMEDAIEDSGRTANKREKESIETKKEFKGQGCG